MGNRPGNQKDLATRRAWYARNKDSILTRKKELRKTGRYKEADRKHKLKYKNIAAERVKKDRIINPEKYAVIFKRYYDKNKDRMKKRRRDYYWNNLEKSRSDCRNRFAYRKYKREDKHYAEEITNLLSLQKYKCINCLCDLNVNKYHVDHVTPLYLGGENTWRNIQILCATCNLKKNRKDPIVWAQQNGRLL